MKTVRTLPFGFRPNRSVMERTEPEMDGIAAGVAEIHFTLN